MVTKSISSNVVPIQKVKKNEKMANPNCLYMWFIILNKSIFKE